MMKIIIDFNIFTITFISMQQLTNNDKINFRIVIYLSIIEIHYGLLYHLLNFKYMKNTLRGVLLFVKVCNFTKSNTSPRVFFTFFKFSKGTKSRNTSYIDRGEFRTLSNIYDRAFMRK